VDLGSGRCRSVERLSFKEPGFVIWPAPERLDCGVRGHVAGGGYRDVSRRPCHDRGGVVDGVAGFVVVAS
jgi:hypothetical protein